MALLSPLGWVHIRFAPCSLGTLFFAADREVENHHRVYRHRFGRYELYYAMQETPKITDAAQATPIADAFREVGLR
jgi:hypothetical protein